MDTREAVKERITELCKDRNLAFNALAINSGVHPSTVKGIINGASQNTGIVTIKKICDGLEITLTEFFDSEIFFSAKTGEGLEELTAEVEHISGKGGFATPGEIIMGARQQGAVARAMLSVKNALSALDALAQDAAGADVEEAIAALGEIDGRAVSEQVVDEIFAKFCVGK